MKARNGGKGMTDSQVEASVFALVYIYRSYFHKLTFHFSSFVDRYIPGYVFFGDGVTKGDLGQDDETGPRAMPPWIGRGLIIQIGQDRQVVAVNSF